MLRLIALYDRPAGKTFAMLSLVAKDDQTGEIVEIGRSAEPKKLAYYDDDEFQRTIDQNCERVDAFRIMLESADIQVVASWVSREFLQACDALDVPHPSRPDKVYSVTDPVRPVLSRAAFWIESPQKAYARMDEWTRRVALMACTSKSAGIARLLGCCLPFHVETMASQWYVSDARERQRTIAFALRCRPLLAKSARELESLFRETVQSILLRVPPSMVKR